MKAETAHHLRIWHYAARASDHGYVLFMIQNICELAVYNKITEWHAKYPEKTTTSIHIP